MALQLSTYMAKDSKIFAVGQNLTYVDFSLFELVDFLNYFSDGQTFALHANLKAYHERMSMLPKFKDAWLDDSKLIK